jgi:hypothetical protein
MWVDPIAFARRAWHVECSPMVLMRARTTKPSAAALLGVLALVASASASLTTACKKDDGKANDITLDEAQALAEDGTDSAVAETDAELVTSSLVSATATSGSLTLASTGELGLGGVGTAGVGDGAKALYFPRGCLNVTADAAAQTVTYAFADCAGPNGIFKLRGTIVATYATAPGKLTLNIVGNDLLVNRATVDWSATAEITNSGADRAMHWKGSLSGTTAHGKALSRTNEKTVTWRFGERCFAVSGVSEGNVRDRYLRTEVTDFRRCQGACPEAGGRITITNDKKLNVEILFDGTNRATYTSTKGTTTFALACQG